MESLEWSGVTFRWSCWTCWSCWSCRGQVWGVAIDAPRRARRQSKKKGGQGCCKRSSGALRAGGSLGLGLAFHLRGLHLFVRFRCPKSAVGNTKCDSDASIAFAYFLVAWYERRIMAIIDAERNLSITIVDLVPDRPRRSLLSQSPFVICRRLCLRKLQM